MYVCRLEEAARVEERMSVTREELAVAARRDEAIASICDDPPE